LLMNIGVWATGCTSPWPFIECLPCSMSIAWAPSCLVQPGRNSSRQCSPYAAPIACPRRLFARSKLPYEDYPLRERCMELRGSLCLCRARWTSAVARPLAAVI
jgi:hypothetical protein